MELENGNIYKSQKDFTPKGISYQKRVEEVNRIYDAHTKDGVSNRHIWKLYIYPIFGISERTFYSYLKKG